MDKEQGYVSSELVREIINDWNKKCQDLNKGWADYCKGLIDKYHREKLALLVIIVCQTIAIAALLWL